MMQWINATRNGFAAVAKSKKLVHFISQETEKKAQTLAVLVTHSNLVQHVVVTVWNTMWEILMTDTMALVTVTHVEVVEKNEV